MFRLKTKSGDTIILGHACEKCCGDGYYINEQENNDPCPDCDASGYVVTENGVEIMRFLRKMGFKNNFGGAK